MDLKSLGLLATSQCYFQTQHERGSWCPTGFWQHPSQHESGHFPIKVTSLAKHLKIKHCTFTKLRSAQLVLLQLYYSPDVAVSLANRWFRLSAVLWVALLWSCQKGWIRWTTLIFLPWTTSCCSFARIATTAFWKLIVISLEAAAGTHHPAARPVWALQQGWQASLGSGACTRQRAKAP